MEVPKVRACLVLSTQHEVQSTAPELLVLPTKCLVRRTSLRERVSERRASNSVLRTLTPIVVLRTLCEARANTDSGVACVALRNTSRSYARQNRPVRFAAKPAAQSWLINGRVRAICRHLRSRAERREQLAAVARCGTTYRRGRPTAAVRVSGLPVPKLPLSSAKTSADSPGVC